MISYRCPLCQKPMTLEGKSYLCPNRHTYDVSREGYVNVAAGKNDSGDDPHMCASRHRFLAAGYYRPFADFLAQTVKKRLTPGFLADCGCGEGYYLRVLREVFPKTELFGADLAKSAVKMAAKCEKDKENPCRYAVCSLFTLPLFDNCADAVLSVFAPVAQEETARILKNGGFLFVAGPGPRHLAGLKRVLYDTPYDNPEKRRDYPHFRLEGLETLSYTVTVQGEAIRDLFAMTPYYWKTSKTDSAKLETLSTLETELSFQVAVYRCEK